MEYKVRFKARYYEADISALRAAIRSSARRGTAEVRLFFYVSEETTKSLDIMIDLRDLYVISFKNNGGHWVYFRGRGGAGISEDGSYGSLDVQLDIFAFTFGKLISAHALKGHPGRDSLTQDNRCQMACVIIAISEAIRFQEVFFNVQSVINGRLKSYIPPSRLLNNWGQLSSNQADVGRVVAIKTVQ
ncbi:ribosome-inactivating family protein [Kluyvera georgiana]|uniref:ribosome-inactivating family protein n=1 Tax=Kluyvera georgiana TaxID=73098 RepID=UPI0032203C31